MMRLSISRFVVISIILFPVGLSVVLNITHLIVPAEFIIISTCVAIFFLNAKFAKNSLGTGGVFLLIFVLTVFLSFYKTYYLESAIDKIIIFIYLIVSKLIIASMVNYKTLDLKLFSDDFQRLSLLIMIFMGILFMLGFTETSEDSSRRFIMGTTNPIWFSRYLSILLIGTIFGYFRNKRGFTLILISNLLGFYMMLESGSRGPALSLLIVYFLMAYESSFFKLSKLAVFLAVLVTLLITINLNFFMDLNPYSIIQRTSAYSFSIDMIKANPLGYGLSSFALLYSGEDIHMYPHNIFLEILFEQGVFGFALFISFIYYVVSRSVHMDFEYKLVYYLFLCSLLNSQFSGDINSNSYLFLFGLISIYIVKSEKFKFVKLLIKDKA